MLLELSITLLETLVVQASLMKIIIWQSKYFYSTGHWSQSLSERLVSSHMLKFFYFDQLKVSKDSILGTVLLSKDCFKNGLIHNW